MQTKKIDMDSVKKGNRATIRENAEKRDEYYWVDLEKIFIRWNARTVFEGIEELAESLDENGQIMPGRVDVDADGNFYLTDGERRYRALWLLKNKGRDVKMMVIVNHGKTTEEDRIIQMFTTQDGMQLKPFEVSELIRRLFNFGYNQTTVAKKLGKSVSYVNQMLEFSRETEGVKNMVKEGHISVSAVAKIKKEIRNPKERSEAIQKAVEKGGKVTAEKVTNSKVRKSEQLADEILILQANTSGEMDKEMIVELINKYF